MSGLGRDRAFVPPSLWHRPDFRVLDREVQWLYLLLLSHPSLSLCGVVDWRPSRLVKFAGDGSAEDVERAGKQLVEAGLIVVDDETEEALVRRFVREDGLLSQPNVAKGMARRFAEVTSMHLRETFLQDLRELRAEDLRRVREDGIVEPKGWQHVLPLLADAATANPSLNPTNPSGKGSPAAENPSSPTGNSLLPSPFSRAAAAAPEPLAPAAEPSAEPPAPDEQQQQPDALDDLRGRLDARGFTDVSWTLPRADHDDVRALIERHGVARLVEAAVAQGRAPRSVKAWLGVWRDLRDRPSITTRTTPSGDCPVHPGEHPIKCPYCARTAKTMPPDFRAKLRRGLQQEPDDDGQDHTGPVEDLVDIDSGGAS